MKKVTYGHLIVVLLLIWLGVIFGSASAGLAAAIGSTTAAWIHDQ